MTSKTTKLLKKQSPFILSCFGAVGVIATAAMAVRATPKALSLIERSKEEKDSEEPLTAFETVKVAWKPYIPAVIIGTATIACIFGSNALSRKQQASLASAYMLLDRSYKEYKEKVKSICGEETHEEIQKEVVKEYYEKTNPIISSPSDNEIMLFYEEHYGNYFERKMIDVLDAEYRLNKTLATKGRVTMNDFFDYLGFSESDIGDATGWAEDVIYDADDPSWIEFEHDLVEMDDGLECYVINMIIRPIKCSDLPF